MNYIHSTKLLTFFPAFSRCSFNCASSPSRPASPANRLARSRSIPHAAMLTNPTPCLARRRTGRCRGNRRFGRGGLETFHLILQLRDPRAQAFENFADVRGQDDAIFAMMTAGVAAFDWVFEFLAAGAAGAGALARTWFLHDGFSAGAFPNRGRS